MFAELLTGRIPKKERKMHEYVGIIEGESDRLQRMVNTILDSARIDKGQQHYAMGLVDLGELLNSVLKTMQYQLSKEQFSVRFNREHGSRKPFLIHADPDAMREVLVNLISNAMKYATKVKEILISIDRDKGNVRCSVQDFGRGISAEAMGHIFERFYRDPQIPQRIQGVGLGLSVVQHIMDAHGGTIKVDSQLNVGSTFTLKFPEATGEELLAAPKKPRASRNKQGPKRLDA
jgi:signal transduction histidine kinase